MERVIIYIALFFSFSAPIVAQNQHDLDSVNKVTYDLYKTQDWKKLLKVGEVAIDNGYDFYYLHLRMGVAYYELDNYRKAVVYLKKSLEINPFYKYARELLFWSYKLSGQDIEAILLESALELSDSAVNSTPERVFHNSIYAGCGMNINNSMKGTLISDKISDKEHVYERIVYDKMDYYSVSGSFRLNEKTTLDLSYSDMELETEHQLKGAFYSTTMKPVEQKQIYAAANFRVGSGLSLTTAVHFVSVELNGLAFDYYENESDLYAYETYDTTYKVGVQDIASKVELFDTVQDVAYVESDTVSYGSSLRDNMFHFGLKKSFSVFDAEVGFSFGSLNSMRQLQTSASIVYYPYGNLNTYLSANYTNQLDGKGVFASRRNVLGFTFGQKILPHLWIESSYTFGELKNFTENNLSVIYSNVYVIKKRIGLRFIMPFERFSVFLDYRFMLIQDDEEYQYLEAGDELDYNGVQVVVEEEIGGGWSDKQVFPYTYKEIENNIVKESNTYEYSNQIISGGIKWNF